MENLLSNRERAEVLTQALPYIKKYSGKIVVIKYGGNAMINEQLKQQVMEDITLLWLIGVKVVLVHGGGPEISETMKKDTMNTLISILEQRGGIKLYDKNVVIKTTGGLYLKEQAANLAVLMSIASSVYDKSIPSDWAFLADVGLTGELKRVPSMESRIKELDRMGFKQVFISAGGMRELHLENIRVVEAKFLSQLLNHVFGKKGNG